MTMASDMDFNGADTQDAAFDLIDQMMRQD